MVPTGGKILKFRLCESLKNELTKTFCSPKLSLESRMLHYLRENFPEYPRDIEISIIVYPVSPVPKHFSWLKKYKLY